MHKGKLSLISMAVITALVSFFVPTANAAQSDTLNIRVTITPSISVNIVETELLLGSVNAGSATVSGGSVTVTNNGSGVNETYSLSLSDPSGWTASQTAAGVDTYVLNAAFSSAAGGIAWNESNHALSETLVASSVSKFAGDQTGANVPYNETRKLWFQFKAPTATGVSTEQAITITITAQAI